MCKTAKWATITIILTILGFVYPTMLLVYNKDINSFIATIWSILFIVSLAKWGHHDSLEKRNAFVSTIYRREQEAIGKASKADDGFM